MRRVLGSLCLLLVAACGDDPGSGPSVPFTPRFTLAPGQFTTLSPGTTFRFVEVTGDSRCPADAVCILGGDALVRVEIRQPNGQRLPHELHTGDSRRATAVFEDLRIDLTELQPYPFSARTIAPEDYRATFAVTRP
jgi:hypothetical protein